MASADGDYHLLADLSEDAGEHHDPLLDARASLVALRATLAGGGELSHAGHHHLENDTVADGGGGHAGGGGGGGGGGGWRARLRAWVERPAVQLALAALLAIDLLAIVAELFLEAEYPPCKKIQAAVHCCPPHAAAANAVYSGGGLGLQSSHHASAAACPSWAGSAACARALAGAGIACVPPGHALHAAHAALFAVTVAVLGIFEVERVPRDRRARLASGLWPIAFNVKRSQNG